MIAKNVQTALRDGALLTLGVVFLWGGSKTALADNDKDIPETLGSRGNFTTLLAAAEAAGLVETLQGEGPFTLFAPTDEAFAKVPTETLTGLLSGPEQLSQVLLYHVVSGSVDSATVVSLSSAVTVQGQSVAISVGDGVQVDGANVMEADLGASNGIVHVIDSVLVPVTESETRLLVRQQGREILISWDTSGGGNYALETRESATGGEWARVEKEPETSASGLSVRLETGGAGAFFRLREVQ